MASRHDATTSRRILLVEDHPVMLLGLRAVVTAQDDLELVGEADSSALALDLAVEVQPDLVVLPLRLGGEFTGVELCREIKSSMLARVLVYTSYNAAEDVSGCLLSGADSFVYKGEESVHLLETIRSTAAGRRIWLLGGEPRGHSEDMRALADSSGLTRREQEVLGFMLQRFTNAQIANELVVELTTVKTHVRSILRKLGLRNRRELFDPTSG